MTGAAPVVLALLVGGLVACLPSTVEAARSARSRARALGLRPTAAAPGAARRRSYQAALPLALEAVARGLRAGAGLGQALAAAAAQAPPALAADLRAVVAGSGGIGLAAASERWAARRGDPGTRLAAAAVSVAAEVGGGAAQALDGVALTLRERTAVAAEVRSLATQARLSAVLMAVAPLAFAGLAGAADPRVGAFLLGTPAGLACLAAGLALEAAGALWMARITRAAS